MRGCFRVALGSLVGCLGVVLGTPGVRAEDATVAAGPAFTERLEFGNRFTLSVACGDYDGDGDMDLAVGNQQQGLGDTGSQLFRNNGDGTFTGSSQFGQFATFALCWGDYDNDGDPDMAVSNSGNQQNQLYVNNGDGTFTGQAHFGAGPAPAVAWADFDLDGDLDLAVGRGILGTNAQNRLYVNNGNGTFTQRDEFGINQSDTVVWGDFDNDGDPDLAVGNGGFNSLQQNFLYVNNGDGTFTERAEFGIGDTASVVWGDYDNDADLDLAVANWEKSDSYLYVNNGDGTFTQQLQFGLRDTNSISWGDYDNDGDLDLAAGNGDFASADQNYLYVNNGDGTFIEQAEFGLGSTDGMAWADFDGDGDIDLAAGNEHSPQQNYLYINNLDNSESLTLHLIGHFYDHGAGHSNRDAVGAKVSVYEQGHLGDPLFLLGYREVAAHGGFSSQNPLDPHFGLIGHAAVDVRIVWPGSAGSHLVHDLEDVAVGQRLTIHEAAPIPITLDPLGPRTRAVSFSVLPAPVAAGSGVALRVTMLDLQNPVPPNNNCCPPPDFSAYESASCTASGEMNACARWVGPPFTYLEAQELPANGNYRAARLQCSPYYHDWSGEGLIHVIGAEIIPSSTYDVEVFAASCKGMEDTCTAVSDPVAISTRRAGDIASPYAPVASGQPNAIDIVGAVNNFKKLLGAPKHVEAQVQPNLPNLHKDVDALDIQAIVSNVKLAAYPFSGPCPCPSTVTCNAVTCANDGACSGGLCVKTCSAGPRLGEACTANKHCGVCVGGTRPGIPCDNDGPCDTGGTCTLGTCSTQGFCRDRCGRCN